MGSSTASADRDDNTRMDIAVKLVREQARSLGRAASFAGVPVAAFMTEVSNRNIPVFTGDAESLRRDREATEAYRQEP